jgi:hypothetical protein
MIPNGRGESHSDQATRFAWINPNHSDFQPDEDHDYNPGAILTAIA